MKTKTCSIIFLAVFVIIAFCASCAQKGKNPEAAAIENTLKSISLIYDSVGVKPSEVLSVFERINSAIDTIGYPDAGYKVWIVQGDSTKGFRFMVEGNWPDKAAYDSIHNHKLYKSLGESIGRPFWKGKKNVSYNRFDLVK